MNSDKVSIDSVAEFHCIVNFVTHVQCVLCIVSVFESLFILIQFFCYEFNQKYWDIDLIKHLHNLRSFCQLCHNF